MADVQNVKIPQPSDELIENWWKLEEQDTASKGPKYVPYWSYGDPRNIDEDNPLYDPESVKSTQGWHAAIDFEKYKNFVLYAHRYLNPANETEADLYHLSDSGVAVFYPQLPGQEERPYDPLQLQAVDSFKDALQQHADGEWDHGLPRAMHINCENGRQQVVLFDYKLKPNAKKSIKGTVLDSFAMNNRLSPEGETFGHQTTLTPVVLSQCDGSEGDGAGKKKNKKNRRKKKNGNDLNDNVEINDNGDSDQPNKVIDMTCATCGKHHEETPHSCQPVRAKKHVLGCKPVKGGSGQEVTLKMLTKETPKCSTLTIQKGERDSYKRTVTSTGAQNKMTTVTYGNEPIPVQPESAEKKSYLPELINSFVATSGEDEQTKVQYNAETNHLVIRREPKKVESSDEESSSSTDASAGKLLNENVMTHLATKLHQMNYVDKIEKPKTHKVQIVKDDENADKAKKNKKDSVNIRFTFNNKAADGNVDALSETKKSFTQEVASIVKTNMGDQPQTLPRNLENMVKQECRKSTARDRLRKKHEMRKNTSAPPSSLLDSLDEGPTSEKPVESPDSSVSKEHGSKGKGQTKQQRAPSSGKTPSDHKGPQTGNSKTEQLMNAKLAEFGIKPPTKPLSQDVLKVAEKILPFQPGQSNSASAQTSDGTKTKRATSEENKKATSNTGKKPTAEGDVPTPERLKYIQDLLKAEYRERYAQHHLSDDSPQQTFIVGQNGPNVQIVIPTKKTPAQILSQHPGAKVTSVLTTDFNEKKGAACDAEEGSPKKRKLRSCANCGHVEPEPRTFKKCQRCRSEGVRKPRYYCGRDCQVEDWGARHKQEHQEDLLG